MAEMKTLTVELAERSYPIHIGPGVLGDAALLKPFIRGHQVCIVTNTTVAPLYLDRLKAALDGFDVACIELPDGEAHKTLEQVGQIYDALLEYRFERSCTLIALGGGVIGDMCGFAAATYQRGVDFIQIPTTLLAQVDSSVGGKTGVNRPLGKNMVGAFYQPRCVLIDTDTLSTLPQRELQAGLAEVVKYGLINNRDFLEWLGEHVDDLLALKRKVVARAIETSCSEKARIVAADEREGGIRAMLNLGHTFGHAIETAMGYGKWLHGEAVAAGMVMATDLSMRMEMVTPAEAQYVKSLLASFGLPVLPPGEMSVDQFLSLMGRDKKAQAGRVRYVLLKRLGRAYVTADVDESLLIQTLSAGEALASEL